MNRIEESIKRYILHIPLFLMSFVICFMLLFVGVGMVSGAGVIPDVDLITSYSSTGGNPQFKDSGQDLIYKIEQGDELTFSITTTQTDLRYLWQVMKGSEVLDSATEGTAFNWIVPSEKSTWEIYVEATLKNEIGDTIGRDYLNWSITTSDLVTVEPSGPITIQDAIDSLPAEGGVVEFTEDTFTISSTIRIRKSNITLRGAGMDRTIIKGDPPVDLLRVDMLDNRPERPWGVWPEDDTFLSGITVEGIHFLGEYSATECGAVHFYAVDNSKVVRIRVTDNYNGGLNLSWCRFMTVNECEVYHNGGGCIGTFALTDSTITGNKVSGAERGMYGAIELNMTQRNTVSHNFVSDTSMFYGIAVYSTTDSRVVENVVENARGIWIYNGSGNEITRNIIKSGYDFGIFVTASDGEDKPAHRTKHILSRNVIYDTGIYKGQGGHGIWVRRKDRPGHPYPLYVTIESNTIYSNEANGIHNEHDQHGEVKNNIIVANGGYGLNGAGQDIFYNNVWNNVPGNYSGISRETGDISVDPLFANPADYDFHLKSQYGRWNGATWVDDDVTSPCINAGDPSSDYTSEPEPNGGRVNMGAYGNTAVASKSYIYNGFGIGIEILVYPNPYRGDQGWSEKITFSNLPRQAVIKIFTISGELVKTIKHEDTADGNSKEWDISEIASGVYIYTIISPENKEMGKVSIVK